MTADCQVQSQTAVWKNPGFHSTTRIWTLYLKLNTAHSSHPDSWVLKGAYPEITVDRGDNEHFAHSQTGVPSTQNSRGAGFPRSFEVHALAVVCLIYSKKQKSTRWSVITWEINLSSKKLGKGCGFPCVTASLALLWPQSPKICSYPQPSVRCYALYPLKCFSFTQLGCPHPTPNPHRLSSACPADDVFLAPANFRACYKQCSRGQKIV